MAVVAMAIKLTVSRMAGDPIVSIPWLIQ